MFDEFTFDYLMQTMLDRVPDTFDKREGSVIWDALAPAALELEIAYIMMDYIFLEMFADTADRDALILRAHERGLVPYPATYAVLKGEFTPTDADVLGKRFNLGAMNYQVKEAITGEAGAYKIVCETAGAVGSQSLGNLIPIDYVEGLESAAATAVLIPGEDEEGTEDFRERYFNSFDNRAYGGNVQDYIDKVSAQDGVGGVRVTPVWDGPRTVECTILDATYGPASATLIASVQDVIDPTQDGSGVGLAPIDHEVTIDTPETVTVNVVTEIEFDTGYSWDNMQTAIDEAVSDYLLELRTDWKNYPSGTDTIVRISQIETRLLALNGIVDVGNTKINGTAANLTVSGNDIPVMGTVTAP